MFTGGWGDLTQPGVTYGTSSWIAFGIHLYHVSKTLLSQQKDSQKKVMQSPLSHPKYKKMIVIAQIVWLFWPRSTLGRYPNQIAWYRLVVRYASLLLSEDRPREAKELLKEARRLGLMSCSVWICSFSNGCIYMNQMGYGNTHFWLIRETWKMIINSPLDVWVQYFHVFSDKPNFWFLDPIFFARVKWEGLFPSNRCLFPI